MWKDINGQNWVYGKQFGVVTEYIPLGGRLVAGSLSFAQERSCSNQIVFNMVCLYHDIIFSINIFSKEELSKEI